MDVQGVNNNFYNNTVAAEQQKVAAAVLNNPAAQGAAAANNAQDVENEGAEYVKTESVQETKYDKTAALEYIRQSQEARMAAFRSMVMKLLNQQNEKFQMTMPEFKFEIPEADVEAAKAAIAEGGEWSVEAVSGRIMEMAYALANGDTSKIGILREAVEQGFKDAEEAWGGEMPEITGNTYDAVMAKFDAWEAEANGTAKDEQAAEGATDLSKE